MDNLNRNIFEKFLRVEMLFHRLHDCYFRHRGPTGTPVRGQGLVLSIIKENPNITQKQLNEQLGMRQQSVAELLRKLENNRYITRVPCKTDRRVMEIQLTKEGIQAAQVPESIRSATEKIFSCLNDEEKDNFSLYLEKIAENLEKHMENDPCFANSRRCMLNAHRDKIRGDHL